MKRLVFGVAVMAAAVGLGLWAFWPANVEAQGKLVDHAFLDQTGPHPDHSMQCGTTDSRPIIVYLAVRAVGGAATLRITFQDGTHLDYPLKQDQSFSLQQAAGDRDGVDNRITVTRSAGPGSLVGWMSASRSPETQAHVVCMTA